MTGPGQRVRHDRLTNAAFAAWFGTCRSQRMKESPGRAGASVSRLKGERALIPNPIDQNPWAHWRSPMDMMRQG